MRRPYTLLALLLGPLLLSACFNIGGGVLGWELEGHDDNEGPDCDDPRSMPDCVNEYCDVMCYNEYEGGSGTCKDKNTFKVKQKTKEGSEVSMAVALSVYIGCLPNGSREKLDITK
ncbi:hypothetical protein H6P81_004847 [Aristolochia fimbriata]|uniref:Secreted protein n=1 Tax=Aristolochia fimbriata TaxID=158543 RepID=A0AAV7ESX0_ARIFI|nr:hypothetical protein H6P81_004847 [Aristolochia fimbriata]